MAIKRLIVVVSVPITLNKIAQPLPVWKIIYFPLSAPDGQEYHTLLADGPRYVVYTWTENHMSGENE